MTPYTIYDATGLILQTGMCPEEMLELQAGPGQHLIEGREDATSWSHYVAQGEVVERPGMILSVSKASLVADGLDAVTITGVPAGARLSITGPVAAEAIADGAPVSMTCIHAGDYVIQVMNFPYRDEEIRINATDPA